MKKPTTARRPPSARPPRSQRSLEQIFTRLRDATGIDLTQYKPNTIRRRIARRQALHKLSCLEDYVQYLQANPAELSLLSEDLFIQVTRFFRDPDTFEALKQQVFPEIVRHKQPGTPIRIWVPGCASGEEVYSIAIALFEFLEKQGHSLRIQIFGSDVSEQAIQRARGALYGENVARDVGEARLKRFFVKVEGGFRIAPVIRDACVFVRHDVSTDPPFSRLDMVSCRNVLIYFAPALQKKVIPLFHYALRQPGYLLLGRTESINEFGSLFRFLDKVHKLYSRKPAQAAAAVSFDLTSRTVGKAGPSSGRLAELPSSRQAIQHEADHILLTRYAPPSVIVNEDLEILQFRGRTGPFLEPAPGQASLSLLKMARKGLRAALRLTVKRSHEEDASVRKEGIRLRREGRVVNVSFEVVPLWSPPPGRERYFLILFEEVSSRAAAPSRRGGAPDGKGRLPRQQEELRRLEQELASTEEYLQSIIDQHAVINDELTSANEELLSSNEELQSTNEELETAKEELQSTNEELTTVNDELNLRNQELDQLNSDLVNVLASVDIPIVIVDRRGCLRRFTPQAKELFNLIPTDVGRPISDIQPNLDLTNLAQMIAEVIETSKSTEREVQTRDSRWQRLRARPYRANDNRIDGAILTLVDVDALKRGLEEARQARDQFLAAASHELRTPLTALILDLQSLQRRIASGEAREEIERTTARKIERALGQTTRLTRLIDSLLDVSRLTDGSLVLQYEEIDLVEVVQSAARHLEDVAERTGCRLVLRTESAAIGRWDRRRMEQVVTHLLMNALQYAPGQPVELAVEANPEVARLMVHDHGPGIPPDQWGRIFERFERAAGMRPFAGLGFGLYVARRVVEAHGGSIHVSSQPGQGSTFVVEVPRRVPVS